MTNAEYNARLDTLAAMAMQGILANERAMPDSDTYFNRYARLSYTLAREMLVEREKYIRKDAK